MKVDVLVQNIIDQIVEAQVKLGYTKESVRLYYTLESLNSILNTEIKSNYIMVNTLKKALKDMDNLDFEISVHLDRIEIRISDISVEYIYKTQKPSPFLVELITNFGMNHHMTIEDIERIFLKYSDKYVVDKMPEGSDFDYILYFEEESVDKYYYCVKMEMGHTIYHRFSKDDLYK